MRASMIGLGDLGLPVAEIMAQFHEIYGYDTVSKSARFNSSKYQREPGIPIIDTMADAIKARELIFVSVGGPYVAGVLDELNEIVVAEQIIVLISKCENVRELAGHITNCRFIYNPYFTTIENMLSPAKIILAFEKDDWNDGDIIADIVTIKTFYNPMMKGADQKPKCIMCLFEDADSNMAQDK